MEILNLYLLQEWIINDCLLKYVICKIKGGIMEIKTTKEIYNNAHINDSKKWVSVKSIIPLIKDYGYNNVAEHSSKILKELRKRK